MAQSPKATILDHFAELDDPPVERTRSRKKDNGPQGINTLRQIGHNLLKNGRTLKGGIPGKRRNAGGDEN